MFFNPQTIDKAIGDIQKAIGSIDVDGLLLVREDLQAELAIMAPTDTPVRNRLNRIQGNGKAHAWYQLNPTSATEGLFLGTAPSNAFFERGGLPNATQASYKYKSAPYVSLGDMIVVSFFDQMAGIHKNAPHISNDMNEFRKLGGPPEMGNTEPSLNYN